MFKLYEIANDYMEALEGMEDVDEETKKSLLNLEAEASAIAESIKRMEARMSTFSLIPLVGVNIFLYMLILI